ncbi:MAG: YkgJ family cysteine cluster protein [Pseudomonadota bacterium]
MSEPFHRACFFDSGIRFRCRQCGRCCTGAPGIIRVSAAEAAAIAAALAMDERQFVRTCLQPIAGSLSIREHADGRCLFYENGCRIYPQRPRQCRTYPFWLSNLRSTARWQETLAACPGIGSGSLFTREAILTHLHAEMADLPDAFQGAAGASEGDSETTVAPQPPAGGGAG